ncbi:MAG: response regulator transcription factor [Anaerolineales bacterium]|nr:response regulator transcription factor [Anaerolineales bacterium]
MSEALILLVDDEPNILALARLYLEREGYRVETAADGPAALRVVAEYRPDVMVLDLMLPDLNGLEVCRQLRAAGNPVWILMLTARDEDVDKILGLEMGADDYLTKPFNPRELVARVKALLRRAAPAGAVVALADGRAVLRLGDLHVDTLAREVRLSGQPLELRNQEFDLLVTMIEHRGQVLRRDQLLNLAWGYDYAGQTRTVDVHIAQLRKHLAGSRVQIETVTGLGYKLVVVN